MRRLIAALPVALSLAGCEPGLVGYAAKQGFRHGSLLMKAESVDTVLARPGLDPKTEHYLRLAKDVLSFAESKGMRLGANYRKYVALQRDWVTQVVMAARKDALEPHLFRYPVVGDLPYKGFYDEPDAVAEEKSLADRGFDTYRREVDAFSTTGWLPDPLVSTMFDSDGRFVELLLHELTHATFYFPNEADFNEAFASWTGYRLALEFIDTPAARNWPERERIKAELTASHDFQMKFADVVKEIVAKGREFYARAEPLAQRAAYFAWIRERLDRDPGLKRIPTDKWNNAVILSFGTYYEHVRPIQAYAERHKLGAAELLAYVAKTGPASLDEILGRSPKNH